MPIPDFQSLMLPLLKLAGDRQEHSLRATIDALASGRAIGRTGDGGIDGIINENRLGLDVAYVQAKRWQGTVGRPDIQSFVGALHGQHARKGVFITTSDFSQSAP
ncbi:MAG: restriction endonuclease [Anaerolineae bacterium]|nr:restriction endonuclease [Anaerolineae bacterium]